MLVNINMFHWVFQKICFCVVSEKRENVKESNRFCVR